MLERRQTVLYDVDAAKAKFLERCVWAGWRTAPCSSLAAHWRPGIVQQLDVAYSVLALLNHFILRRVLQLPRLWLWAGSGRRGPPHRRFVRSRDCRSPGQRALPGFHGIWTVLQLPDCRAGAGGEWVRRHTAL